MTASTEQLLRLWRWIERATTMCYEAAEDTLDDMHGWPAEGLVDAGVYKLLEMDSGKAAEQIYSPSLSCPIFESDGRRYVAMASRGY